MQQSVSSSVETLKTVGLTQPQALLYEALINHGSLPASAAALRAGLARQSAYKILDELMALGLAEKHDKPGAVAQFTASHPVRLKELGEKHLQSLNATISDFVSLYNLSNGKPGVRFYEGYDGIKECLDDALTSHTEIYSYVDISAVEREIPDASREFAKARQKLGLKKKNIGIDTPQNRAEIEGYYSDVTEERLIEWPSEAIDTVMQIYDGRVSYFTITDPKIGIIVADPHIYRMHKTLFELTWNSPGIYIPKKD